MISSLEKQLHIISDQIDWDFIAEIQKDKKQFEKFKREGDKMFELVRILREVDSSA